MIENFLFSANVVTPVFLMIFIGFVLRKTNRISKEFINEANKLMFNFGLPALLFLQISTADFNSVFDINLMLFGTIVTLIVFFLTWFLTPLCIKDKTAYGSFIQGCFRGNYALIGLPLSINLFGQEATAKSSVLLAIIVITYNVLAVIILDVYSPNKESHVHLLSRIRFTFLALLKNPLLIGIIIALPFSIFKIQLSFLITKPLDYIGSIAIPLSLIGIGGSFEVEKAMSKMKLALMASSIKTIITPLVFLPIAILIGFRGVNLGIIAVLFTAPTAINSYIMAKETGNDSDLAGNIVVVSSAMSLFTAFISVYILKILQLI